MRLAVAGAAFSDVGSAEPAAAGNTDIDPVIRVPVNAKKRRCAAKAMLLRQMSLPAHLRINAPVRPVCGAVWAGG